MHTKETHPFRVLDIAGSGLAAERKRLEVIAANLANANTVKSPDGGPYRRREIVFESVLDGHAGDSDRLPSVKVKGVVKDMSDLRRVFDPGHPNADKDGYVTYPNVDPMFEMVDLMQAMRSYEASLRSVRAFRTMVDAALRIGRA